MRIAAVLASFLLVVLVFAGAAGARDQLNQKDAIVVLPQKSYIFYRTSQRLDVRFLREVAPAEQATWQTARSEALVRARAAFPRRLRQWQLLEEQCRGSQAPNCLARGERPVAPTEQNFDYPPPELQNFLIVSSGPQFTRADNDYSYLIAVEPGTYILYGQVVTTENGNTGYCLCMGSVRFEAPAGRIVDLGRIRYPVIEDGQQGAIYGPNRRAPMAVVPPDAATPLPDRLTGQPVVPAVLRAADKMPNYFGVQIDRLAAIPNVLGYERDRVIDLGTAAPTPPAP